MVISQPEAALYIQPPTLETNVAVQMTANAGCRNGAANDTVVFEVVPVAWLMAGSGRQSIRTKEAVHLF